MSQARREQKFWRYLKRHFSGQNIVDFKRIENQVSNSMPDLYFSSDFNNGCHGFIELKVLVPKNNGYAAPHFSQGQRNWIIREWLRGARPFILVRLHEPCSNDPGPMYLLKAEVAREPLPWTEDTLDKYCLWRAGTLNHHSVFKLMLVLTGSDPSDGKPEYEYYVD